MLGLDAYKLKWIAIIGMILNHIVVAWWEIVPIWLAIPFYAAGGLTFPIMAFFVVEGYKHTSNLGRYILRLFIFGLIAIPFHVIALGMPLGPTYPFLNILFAIILSLLVLLLYDKIKIKALFWLLYIIVIVPLSFIFIEWYFIGTTTVLLFYIIKNENVRRIVPPIFAGVAWLLLGLLSRVSLLLLENVEGMEMPVGLIGDTNFINVMLFFFVGCIVAAVLLKNYSGERGKSMKWLFYIIYPVHLAVLAGVAVALGLVSLNF